MGKTNFDELELGGALTATDITASDTLTYDDLAVTDNATVGGNLTVTGQMYGITLNLDGGFSTYGEAYFDKKAEITGDVTVGGLLQLDGDPQFEGISSAIFGIEAADATDEATAVALANEIKAKYNTLIVYLRTGTVPSDE